MKIDLDKLGIGTSTSAPIEETENVFDVAVSQAEAKLTALQTRLTRAEADAMDSDWIDHLRERVTAASTALDFARSMVDSPAIHAAWRDLDAKYTMVHAEALVAAINAEKGGPTVRIWSKPGIGVRVYFPGEAGFLDVDADGSLHETLRGRIMFNVGALWPAWKRAVAAGRRTYRAGLAARLTTQGEERVRVAEQIRRRRG